MKILSLDDGKISLKTSWLITFISLFVSLAFAAGGYKAAFTNQQNEVTSLRQEIGSLKMDFENLRIDMATLSTSLNDLKISIDKKAK